MSKKSRSAIFSKSKHPTPRITQDLSILGSLATSLPKPSMPQVPSKNPDKKISMWQALGKWWIGHHVLPFTIAPLLLGI